MRLYKVRNKCVDIDIVDKLNREYKQMAGFDFEKFKLALKNIEEEKYAVLQEDVKKVRNVVEKVLTMAMENTASVSRRSYAGLDMF